MKVNIGKNTLGGGKKMAARLNNYNRSTHNLSRVVRTTAAPGTLIPTFKEKVLPGDTFDIKTRCHILTHPTVGPLFGSFKVQNDFFFCPDRLYIAALHNNALNVGLNMKSVKYPKLSIDASRWADRDDEYIDGSAKTIKRQVHPSSLPAYLGYKTLEFNETNEGDTYYKPNITPVIAYFDIFKNYYANKQETKFYTVEGQSSITAANNGNIKRSFFFAYFDKKNDYSGKWQTEGYINNPTTQVISLPSGAKPGFVVRDIDLPNLEGLYLTGFIEITPISIGDVNLSGKSVAQLISEGILEELNIEKPYNADFYRAFVFKKSLNETATIGVKIKTKIKSSVISTTYKGYDLVEIDNLREAILAAGKKEFDAYQFSFISDIFAPIEDIQKGENKWAPNCIYPLTGLALKTYQSDINTNWVNTEWIDGETGINAITAIDTSSGSFTLDTLNLAKKVYTMLNRIAVSDGSYNAWIQTVYTSGGLNHVETPIYLGGSSMEIEFQEVINNSGTEDQPLGSLAGRGVTSNHKGGNIKYKPDEPGYIFCITSITPRVDYFQGNDWDLYINDLDELHKPQLDGIGFQDRLYKNINASARTGSLNSSIGKQPAWIDYMTSYNRTLGNFALIENEGWMCLNRIFGDINTYTTYVQPHLYNNIFADTEVTAQNFWVQIAFNVEARRVMSAKIIPNL